MSNFQCPTAISLINLTDNNLNENCTVVGNFGESFNVSASGWNDSNFVIDKITDFNDSSKVYAWSLSGVSGNINISSFKIVFANVADFSGQINLSFILKPQKFGYTQSLNQ